MSDSAERSCQLRRIANIERYDFNIVAIQFTCNRGAVGLRSAGQGDSHRRHASLPTQTR